MKKFTLILSLLLAVSLFASCSGVNTETDEIKASISIYVEDEDRFILEEAEITAKEGTTVFDVLKDVTKENKIHMDFEQTAMSSYVKGIDNLYTFDKGELSGWLFYVNGKSATRGADQTEVNNGDKIEWIFVTDFTKTE